MGLKTLLSIELILIISLWLQTNIKIQYKLHNSRIILVHCCFVHDYHQIKYILNLSYNSTVSNLHSGKKKNHIWNWSSIEWSLVTLIQLQPPSIKTSWSFLRFLWTPLKLPFHISEDKIIREGLLPVVCRWCAHLHGMECNVGPIYMPTMIIAKEVDENSQSLK